MKCQDCARGLDDGPLFRTNPKGLPGLFSCARCRVPKDEELAGIVAQIERMESAACPWCGAKGPNFDESPRPSDYCHHDPAEVLQ